MNLKNNLTTIHDKSQLWYQTKHTNHKNKLTYTIQHNLQSTTNTKTKYIPINIIIINYKI
ncbi:hypothetical protein CsatB_030293 [Cannabis sativa]